MCRNIKTLANFEPPATDDEIRASALQFVRKLSGMNKPSKANEAAFTQALEDFVMAELSTDDNRVGLAGEGLCCIVDRRGFDETSRSLFGFEE